MTNAQTTHATEPPVNVQEGNPQGRRPGRPHKPPVGQSFADVHPDLAAQWVECLDYPGVGPSEVSAKAGAKVRWRCSEGHEWEAIVRVVGRAPEGRNGCRQCYFASKAGIRVREHYERKTLAEAAPQLIAQWHPTKNGDTDPATLWQRDTALAWWLCRSCGHEWEAAPAGRVKMGTDCPRCAMKGVGRKNRARYASKETLAEAFPGLANEWAYDLNPADLTPETVAPGSATKVYWRCTTCPEVWLTSPHTRTRQVRAGIKTEPARCPACINQVVRPWNCLAQLRPDIAAQWHPDLNGDLTAEQVTVGGNALVWWQCDEGHAWRARVDKRANLGQGCPHCTLRQRSKAEVRLEHELAAVLPVDQEARRIRGTASDGTSWSYEADIVIPSMRLVVEYDGAYWHSDPGDIERDLAKTVRLMAAGWRVLRLREKPLALTRPEDLAVPRGAAVFKLASAVLGQVAIWFPAAAPACEAYIAGGVPLRAAEAEAAIATLPKWPTPRRRRARAE